MAKTIAVDQKAFINRTLRRFFLCRHCNIPMEPSNSRISGCTCQFCIDVEHGLGQPGPQQDQGHSARLRKSVLPSTFEEFLKVFFNDSFIFSKLCYKEHYVMVKAVFEALKKANLKISSKKTKIAVTEFTILGLKISTKQAETFLDYNKASSILTWPRPASLFESKVKTHFSIFQNIFQKSRKYHIHLYH